MDRRLTGLSTDRDVIMPFEGMQRYETDLPGGPQFITYQFGKWWTELQNLTFEVDTAFLLEHGWGNSYRTEIRDLVEAFKETDVHIRANHRFHSYGTDSYFNTILCYYPKYQQAGAIEAGKWYEIKGAGNFTDWAGLGGTTSLGGVTIPKLLDGLGYAKVGEVFQALQSYAEEELMQLSLYEHEVTGTSPLSQFVTVTARVQLIGDTWRGEDWLALSHPQLNIYTPDTSKQFLISQTTFWIGF